MLMMKLQIWQTAGNGTRLLFIVSEAAHMARDASLELE
jgi:DNA replication licensing factor MCM7